jgi:hypothetical protein
MDERAYTEERVEALDIGFMLRCRAKPSEAPAFLRPENPFLVAPSAGETH